MAEQTAAEQARDAIARIAVDVGASHVKSGGEWRVEFTDAAFTEFIARVLASPALADHLATVSPDTLLDALTKTGALEVKDHVEWCEERCYASTYSSPYTCGDRCNLAGPHDRHECVDGHTWPVEADDHHPKRSTRLVTPWREVEP